MVTVVFTSLHYVYTLRLIFLPPQSQLNTACFRVSLKVDIHLSYECTRISTCFFR